MIAPAVIFGPLVRRTVRRLRVSYLMHGIDFNLAADPMQAMQATDRHAAHSGRTRRILVRMFQRELGDAPNASPKPGRLLENATKATSVDAFSGVNPVFFGPKLILFCAVISAVAILVTFAAVVFVSAWHGLDCQSPRRSISIGNAVLVAGCSHNSSRFGRGP